MPERSDKNKGIYFQTVIMNKRCVEKLLKLVTTLIVLFGPSGNCGLFPDGLGLFQCVSAAEGIVEIDYSTDFVKTVCGFCQLGLKKVLLG